jgi:hypothetical protein
MQKMSVSICKQLHTKVRLEGRSPALMPSQVVVNKILVQFLSYNKKWPANCLINPGNPRFLLKSLLIILTSE